MELKDDDVITLNFHIMQNGKPVSKEMKLTRETLIKYNQLPKDK